MKVSDVVKLTGVTVRTLHYRTTANKRVQIAEHLRYLPMDYFNDNSLGAITSVTKPIDNIGNRDYLQVLAYMFRFDAKAGYYLYPEAEGSDDLKLWLNRGSTYEKNVMPRNDISVTKHGLKIPVDALNYAEFFARMKTCEQEFKSALIF